MGNDVFAIAAAVISALSTLLGGAAASSALQEFFAQLLKRAKPVKIEISMRGTKDGRADGQSPKSRFDMAKEHVLVRLAEARAQRTKQQTLARRSRISANLLTFGQYILGVVTATSFIQKALSADLISVFGVLVVASSLVKQHYRPEVTAQTATQKSLQFEGLIRQTEDCIVVIQTKTPINPDEPSLMLDLLEKLSADITRIMTANDPASLPAAKTKDEIAHKSNA